MSAIPEFDKNCLQRICEVLGDTHTGLTGSEIGRYLAQLSIEDPASGITKRYRLYEALSRRQREDRCGNLVAAFIQTVMNPVLYTESADDFDSKREELNRVLFFCGYELGEDGKLRVRTAVKTLTEAEERAGKLKAELKRRGVHPDILKFCRAELIQQNYFHAVFEATKSVADKTRQMTGLASDGASLIDQAFGIAQTGIPLIAFNSL